MISVQTIAPAMTPPQGLPSSEVIRFDFLPGQGSQQQQQQQQQQQRLPAVRQQSPSSELSPSDFRTYNRMAELMELYHNNFRHTFRTFYHAVSTLDPSTLTGPTVKQIVALGTTFLHNLREHETSEDSRLYPTLAARMPAFINTTSTTKTTSRTPFGAATASGGAFCSQPPSSTSWPPSLCQQQRHLVDHSLRIENYLIECREGKRELQRDELTAELNSFGGVLFSHLDEEVRELGAEKMRKFWSLDEVRALEL